MKKLIKETAVEILEEYTNCYSEADEDCLVEMLNKLASEIARETITEAIEVLQEKLLLSVMSNGRYVYEKDDVLFWLRTIPLRMKKKYESEGNK